MTLTFKPADLAKLPGTLRAALGDDNPRATWCDLAEMCRVIALDEPGRPFDVRKAAGNVYGAIGDALFAMAVEDAIVPLARDTVAVGATQGCLFE